MSADLAWYSGVFSGWGAGIMGVISIGLLSPFLLVMLGAGVIARGLYTKRDLAGIVGSVALLWASGLISFTQAAKPGAPPPAMWMALTAILFLTTAITTTFIAGDRLIHRWWRQRSLRRPLEVTLDLEDHSDRTRPTSRAVSAEQAEHLVAEWLHWLGVADAQVTPFRRDGGVDVRSQHYVVQVKNRTDRIPVTALRELHGVATLEHRQPLFFAASSYSRDALAFAREVDMPLFIFRATAGRLIPANPSAVAAIRDGLEPASPSRGVEARGGAPAAR